MGFYRGPNIVTDGLVFAIDAGSTRSYPGSGTTVADLKGVNNGTLSNGVGFNTANGGFLEFDGVDDRLTLTSNVNLGNGNVAWTLSAWVKSTTTVNALSQGAIASNDGSGPVYSVMSINSGKMCYWTYQSGWVQNLGVATVNDGEWHLLTWVNYTNYTMDMYVDGSVDKSITNSTSGNNNPIDAIGNSFGAIFDGDIAPVYIYQGKSLTAAEVLQNYNAQKSRFGL